MPRSHVTSAGAPDLDRYSRDDLLARLALLRDRARELRTERTVAECSDDRAATNGRLNGIDRQLGATRREIMQIERRLGARNHG